VLLVLVLSCALLNTFFLPHQHHLAFGFNDYARAALWIFLSTACVLIEWALVIRYFRHAGRDKYLYAAIVVSPIALLYFWDPQLSHPPLLVPVGIVLVTQLCMFWCLSANPVFLAVCTRWRAGLCACLLVYTIAFLGIAIWQYHHVSNFNPKDFAIYNQTFWNTLHGRVFQNTAYGSNFACHNSPFFFLLVPLYALVPHPVSLFAIRTVLLALSAVPFALIIRRIISQEQAMLPIILAYLAYPYLISQNLIAPHEVTFAPFFVLFTYYWYQVKRFWWFIACLVITVSIKEHVSLIAIMFGIHAFVTKRSGRWVMTPVILGIVWGICSVWVIDHFQRVYHPHVYSAWAIEDIKRRFVLGDGNAVHAVVAGLSGSNIGKWYVVREGAVLLACVGGFLPLLSLDILLGMPELLIALLSSGPAMLSVPWHYMILFSCFLLISAVQGIRKLSEWPKIRARFPSRGTLQTVLAIGILSSTLMHLQTWVGLVRVEKTGAYVRAVQQALAAVPKEAFITVPRAVAPLVSSRERYTIVGEAWGGYGEYLLLDEDDESSALSKGRGMNTYRTVFDASGITLLKRTPG